MRINKYLARATGLSRRAADQAINEGRVMVNLQPASPGTDVTDSDTITLDSQPVVLPTATMTIMLNKPVGYVCSRDGQGSDTVYDLLPEDLHQLKPVGRLDKDSSGLLLMTNDGDLANQLTHPRYAKEKVYRVELDKPLSDEDEVRVKQGVKLDDEPSKLQVTDRTGNSFTVTMSEGRNRQIRRTFAELGYSVQKLHRTQLGELSLGELAAGKTSIVKSL